MTETPWLVQRGDGAMVEVSRLLFAVATYLDGRPLDLIAASVSADVNRPVTESNVAYLIDHKLVPLGLVPSGSAAVPNGHAPRPVLTLALRGRVLPQPAVEKLARVFAPLFWPPIVILALVALVALDVLLLGDGLAASALQVARQPELVALTLAILILAMAFHELGHAAALRYSGARPGPIGVGIYIVWPAFYADVTNVYRLDRRGRLRTDLGGLYFNAVLVLVTAAVYLPTQYQPLLVVIALQQLQAAIQLVPFLRLDGYHIVSDLIGVPDLFGRVGPILASLVTRHKRDSRVTGLRPWARRAVVVWVVLTTTALSAAVVLFARGAPSFVAITWESTTALGHKISGSVSDANLWGALGSLFQLMLAILPAIGLLILVGRGLRALSRRVGARHARTAVAEREDRAPMRPSTPSPEVPARMLRLRPTAPAREPWFRRSFGVLRRRKRTIAFCALLALGADLAYSLLQAPVYAADAQLLVQGPVPDALLTGPSDKSSTVGTEILIIESRDVRAAVERRLGYRPDVTARRVGNSDVIRLEAEAATPLQAVQSADTYATTYAELRRKQLVDELALAKRDLRTKITEIDSRIAVLPPGPEKDALITDRAQLQSQVDRIDADSALAVSHVKVLNRASLPGSPVRPKTVRDAIIAFGAGLLVGVLVAALLESVDDSVNTKTQLEKVLRDIPVIALIPRARHTASGEEQLMSHRDMASPSAEAYRKLRTTLQFARFEGPMQTLQVTSPSPMQGKSTTVANLGIVIAQAGLRVVIVCCDLRRPDLHGLFGLSNTTGFTSVLVGVVPLSAAVQTIEDHPRLSVLTSGPLPPNPSELLASRRTVEVLTSLQAEYDVVVLDTPPVLPVADAAVLSYRVDATLISCVAGVTTKKDVVRAAESLRLVDAPLIGTVLHGAGSGRSAADVETYSRDAPALPRESAGKRPGNQ